MFTILRILAFPPSLRQALIRTAPRYFPIQTRRGLTTLAIETSCDDTAVAVLEKRNEGKRGEPRAVLHFNKKITSNNSAFRGIHPLVAHRSHQRSLANLIDEAIQALPTKRTDEHGRVECAGKLDEHEKRWPDFVAVTRGPGMRANLSTGLDTAKGLAVAWQIPLVGVHHMQAHALTPRLIAALQPSASTFTSNDDSAPIVPEFPFLSVLVSGGHTLLVLSKSLRTHTVLASTADIAIGECLDKVARVVLPEPYLESSMGTMYGALLENFAFSEKQVSTNSEASLDATAGVWSASCIGQYKPPYPMEAYTAEDYMLHGSSGKVTQYSTSGSHRKNGSNITEWGWGFNSPLSNTAGGCKHNSMELSFSGLTSAVERAVSFSFDKEAGKITKKERDTESIGLEERRTMAREAMRAAFEHLSSRIILALNNIRLTNPDLASKLLSVVVSGGVASNGYLRHLLATALTAYGHHNMRLFFPPPSLCTDNAAMIAWTGIEMYEAGFTNDYSIRAIRKWPMEKLVDDLPSDA